jgi:hypothetical protein
VTHATVHRIKRLLKFVSVNCTLLCVSATLIALGRRQPPSEALQTTRASEAFRDVIDFSLQLPSDMPTVGELRDQHGPPSAVELNFDGFGSAAVLRYPSFSARVAQSKLDVGLNMVTSRLTPYWRVYRLQLTIGTVHRPCVVSDWNGFTSLVRYFPGAGKAVKCSGAGRTCDSPTGLATNNLTIAEAL